MSYKRNRRKPDLFALVLIAVTIGVSATVAYQINVYYGGSAVPIATRGPAIPGVGG